VEKIGAKTNKNILLIQTSKLQSSTCTVFHSYMHRAFFAGNHGIHVSWVPLFEPNLMGIQQKIVNFELVNCD
jgi:hypothetical protein